MTAHAACKITEKMDVPLEGQNLLDVGQHHQHQRQSARCRSELLPPWSLGEAGPELPLLSLALGRCRSATRAGSAAAVLVGYRLDGRWAPTPSAASPPSDRPLPAASRGRGQAFAAVSAWSSATLSPGVIAPV
ncbi:hypothetical protein ACRAWD_10465 [Caulobacter segnis]